MEFHKRKSILRDNFSCTSLDSKIKKNMDKGLAYSIINSPRLKELEFNGQKFFLISGIFMEMLIVSNLVWSCIDTFECSIF